MPVNKSELLNQLSKTYPNILKRDLSKFINIFLHEVKKAIKNNERVELRRWGIFYPKVQKSRNSRNPKTGEKVITPQKKNIYFKMSSELFEKINEK